VRKKEVEWVRSNPEKVNFKQNHLVNHKEKTDMGVAIIVAALIGAIWLEPKWMLIVIAVTAMAGASVVSFIRK